jgi:hypothetical protein
LLSPETLLGQSLTHTRFAMARRGLKIQNYF